MRPKLCEIRNILNHLQFIAYNRHLHHFWCNRQAVLKEIYHRSSSIGLSRHNFSVTVKMDSNSSEDHVPPVDNASIDNANPQDIEEMDITDDHPFLSYDQGSSSSEYSDSSQESFDDDASQTSDIRVISEVSSCQVPVTNFEEGKARIQVPVSFKVFFNPVQEFNRDLSIAVLTLFAEDHFKEERSTTSKRKNKKGDSSQNIDDLYSLHLSAGIRYKEGIEILEALSASGLRAIRYALEVPGVKQITANDMSRSAVVNIEDNIELNNVEDIVITSQSDAVWLMQQQKADNLWFDAIDLDPYGCPSKFLDSAVNAVRDGGLLLVTCTDMAVLAGNTPESCYSKYGAISLRNSACHEMALRIALQSIESHCNRYGRYIVPLLSVSADFYIRLFLKVYTSPQKCKQSLSKLSTVFQCNGCCSLTLQPLGAFKDAGNNQFKYSLPNGPAVGETCAHCGQRHHMGGPIWNGPIHDKAFVRRLITLMKKSMDKFQTSKRMLGMLSVIDEELTDVPLYYTLSSLCNRVHCTTIPLKEFRSALLNAGFEVSLSHCASNSIKTNAPISVVWDIMRCWVKTHPVAEKRLLSDPVCANLLKKEPEFIANFDVHPDAVPESIKNGLLRFQLNPAPNWGPGCRSSPKLLTKSDKRQHNQNKRKRAHHSADGSSYNGNRADIPIVTLSDDDSMDCNRPVPENTLNTSEGKKQRLADLDTSIEITDSKIISIDDDEVSEVVDVDSSNPNKDSTTEAKKTVEIVESAEVGAEIEKTATVETDCEVANSEKEGNEISVDAKKTEESRDTVISAEKDLCKSADTDVNGAPEIESVAPEKSCNSENNEEIPEESDSTSEKIIPVKSSVTETPQDSHENHQSEEQSTPEGNKASTLEEAEKNTGLEEKSASLDQEAVESEKKSLELSECSKPDT